MPNKSKEFLEVEEVPQVRDMTTPKTVFVPKEVKEDDVPMTGYLLRNEEKPINFKEWIINVIENLNLRNRTKAVPVLSNPAYKKEPKIVSDGGRIK